jgi:hypothetical protein
MMTVSRSMAVPRIRQDFTGMGARPGAAVIAGSPNSMIASAGRATDTPMAAQILTSVALFRRNRNTPRYRMTPTAGATTSRARIADNARFHWWPWLAQ